MNESQYTKAAIFKFLDMSVDKGLMNPSTGRARKTACIAVLEDVADTDDVRSIDIPGAMIRYNNRHPGELSPASVGVYQGRAERAIKSFLDYVADPASFKPIARSQPRANGDKNPVRKKRVLDVSETGMEPSAPPATTSYPPAGNPTPSLALSFPLRADFLAQVVVPRDLATEEARRLCAFIQTLAIDFQPT